MSDSVILLGGGGHAKVIAGCIRSRGDEVSCILDDGIAAGTMILDIPVLGKISEFESFLTFQGKKQKFLIAIGNIEVCSSTL